MLPPRRIRPTAWVALCALLLATLAPAVSAWVGDGARAGTIFAELCTDAGMVRVAVADAGDDAPGTVRTGHGECPLCAAHTPALAGPIARAGVPVPPGLHESAPSEPTFRGRARVAWSPAQPRAPPSAA